MNAQQLQVAHRRQAQLFRRLRRQVEQRNFVYRGNDPQVALRAKLRFLRVLKTILKRAFSFNGYQAEFVKNEAMRQVLYPQHVPERMLVAPDPKKAEKLVHTSFVLGRHYFRFIMTML